MRRKYLLLLIFFSVLGFADSLYLTWEHFQRTFPPCSVNWWVDCGRVLGSVYSEWWGVPVAFFGVMHYGLLFMLTLWLFFQWRRKISWWLLAQAMVGFLFSCYFVAVQLFIIQAICLYCMASALISCLLFVMAWQLVSYKRLFFLRIFAWQYQILKKVLFLFPPEAVHTLFVRIGEGLGKINWLQPFIHQIFNPPHVVLQQEIAGMVLRTPIGLAAGFDYEARLTQTLAAWGFGFQSIGTITNHPCVGNKKPRLGRLPHSRALLVNKGFRNPGVKAIIRKLARLEFPVPLGISVGQTNLMEFHSVEEVIEDIVDSFRVLEKSKCRQSFYELNISCPNLASPYNFYDPQRLEALLTKVDDLHLSRPLFVKMPISESNKTILALLTVIAKHSPVGVIIGNLQKDRHDPAVVPTERQGLGPGNLSGKPTFQRSNELIALAYQSFSPRLIIIGCGGIFTAEDAYLKICLGASALQMITGLIFQGPQVVAEINAGLIDLLKADGYTTLSKAIGSKKGVLPDALLVESAS